MKTIYFPSFYSGKKHGGWKRTHQIHDSLCTKSNTDSVVICDCNGTSELKNLSTFIYFIFELLKGFSLKISPKTLIRKSISLAFIKSKLKGINKSEIEIIVEQASGLSLFYCEHLIDKGYSYTLYTHNVEFCVAHQSFRDDGFCYEVLKRSYLNAKRIFCISQVDLEIISIFNQNVLLFEYEYNEKNLDEIKNERIINNNFEAGVLMLGSALNPPTKEGMEKLIKKINLDNSFLKGKKFVVAGYGTEIFSYLNSNRVTVLGTLSEEELHKLYVKIEAIIINQPSTTGFLTRISEAQSMNIPVFINSTYYQIQKNDFNGVVHYKF